jgi:ClpP class serine protease
MLFRRRLKALAPASTRTRFHEGTNKLLAIEPSAATALYDEDAHQEEPRIENGVAIVEICGPLEQRANWLWDGYDAIQCRFKAALESSAESVLLLIDSPGGDVAGLFDAVHAMRLAAAEAGKKVIAYAEEGAYSAAYALATAADEIILPQAGGVGSIGVIATVYDQTEATRNAGLNVVVLTSGEEKADGHPDVPLEEEALGRMQARIDSLAEQFATLVAEKRGGVAEKWLSLEAGVRYGQDAVDAGLADKVMPCYELLENLASSNSDAKVADKDSQMDLKVLRANLEAAQRSGDQAKVKAASDALLTASAAKKMADEDDADEDAESAEDEADEDAESKKAEDEEKDAESAEESAEEPSDEEEPKDDDEEDAESAEDGKYKKASKADASRIARAAAQLTGKSNPDEIVGTLRGLVASARQGREAADRLAKIETRLRKADVEKLIAKGMRDRKITPASKAHFEKIGMRSPRELSAMLKAMAPVAAAKSREAEHVTTRDGYQERPTDAASQIANNFGVSLEAMATEAAKHGTRFPRG